MGIYYGNIPLLTGTASLRQAVERRLSLADCFKYAEHFWPGPRRQMPDWALPHRPLKLGTLWWPTTASRFAVGTFLADSQRLSQIRSQAYRSPEILKPLVLRLGSKTDTQKKIETSLYLLPPAPLSQIPGLDAPLRDLYLLTLVDARFFWWEVAASLTVDPGVTTWAELIADIGEVLGTAITPDTIDADYLYPGSGLGQHYPQLPPLLDAVCAAIGHRFVRRLDGTCVTQSPQTAKTVHDGELRKWSHCRGGLYHFDPRKSDHDFPGLVPKEVTVLFPRLDDGTPSQTPYAVTTTLASLALTEYPTGFVGRDGTKILRTTLSATFAGGATPSNAAEVDALAAQMAEDFYRWQIGRQHQKFVPIVPYVPEGLTEFIEWTHAGAGSADGEGSTFVQRAPWLDPEAGTVFHAGSDGSETGPSCCGWVIISPTEMMPIYDIWFPPGLIITIPGTITIDDGLGSGAIGEGNVIWYPDVEWKRPVIHRITTKVCWEKLLDEAALAMNTTISTGAPATELANVLFEIPADATVKITGVFLWSDVAAPDAFESLLYVDGDLQVPAVPITANGLYQFTWLVPLTAGGHEATIAAWKTGGTAGTVVASITKVIVEAEFVIDEGWRFHLPNGTLLTDNLCFTNQSGCCPEEQSGSGTFSGDTTTDCGACPEAAPLEWEFSIAGVTDGSCADCAEVLNAVWTLPFFAECTWNNAIPDFCDGFLGVTSWTLTYESVGDYWSLSCGVAQYRVDGSQWNCLSSNTMTLFTNTGHCADWPETVEIYPV